MTNPAPGTTSTINYYLLAIVIVLAAIVLGALLVQRAYALNRAPTRKPADPRERFEQALVDMRHKGIATPEELSAQTEAAAELSVPPPDIPGFPQTPADARRQSEEKAAARTRRRPARRR